LELDNDIKGVEERKAYIKGLIKQLPDPDLVVLPEMALCSYMASQDAWKYADDKGHDTAKWAVEMARIFDTYIGVGYLDREGYDYYNRYLIASKDGVLGIVSKSEGESAVFRQGDFPNIIETPFGKVGVAICYDSRRKHFYDNVKDEELSLILFPHGAPADPKKPETERQENDRRCMLYVDAFDVPVVYVNSKGSLEYMPGMMGAMMKRHGFRINGMSKIYGHDCLPIVTDIPEVIGVEVTLKPHKLIKEIRFYGQDILPGNFIFKHVILKPDTKAGIAMYEANNIRTSLSEAEGYTDLKEVLTPKQLMDKRALLKYAKQHFRWPKERFISDIESGYYNEVKDQEAYKKAYIRYINEEWDKL
ncbi:MAG: carbon-nitrogen hydrolase family protein, partial [Erysipelotrichaceae bacterium]|nr:carbon-nitrogen hydrolase family protein [Erysipelotrichaceae bacterium]